MKLVRSTKRKMVLALNQLVETQINTNFLGVHDFFGVHDFLGVQDFLGVHDFLGVRKLLVV